MSQTDFDIGPLTWVKAEIDTALARATESLDAALAQPDQREPVRFAQNHVHQASGALSIVGLDGVSQFSEALDKLLSTLAGHEDSPSIEALSVARRSLAVLANYLNELLAGAPHKPLRLYPAYRELVVARGEDDPQASELFFPDLSARPALSAIEPPDPASVKTELRVLRGRFEKGLLMWLRQPTSNAGAEEMLRAVQRIEQIQSVPATRAFWWSAIAFFEGLAQQVIPVERATQRLCRRIDMQMRRLIEGSQVVAERLVRDVLYFVATANISTPHARSVRKTYHLESVLPDAGQEVSGTLRQPLVMRVREALEHTKDAWNRFCAGAAVALPLFQEQLTELGTRVTAMQIPPLEKLLAGITEVANWLRTDPLRQSEALSMEVATGLLVVEQAVESPAYDRKLLERQVELLSTIYTIRSRGGRPPAMDDALFGEASQQAQEKLFFNQLAREILTNLGQIEQTLDAFFRNPAQREALATLGGPLKQIEGALSILGQTEAAALVTESAARVEAFATATEPPSREECDEVAHKLSALGFYVEALKTGPAKLQHFLDPSSAFAAEEDKAAASGTVEAQLLRESRETRNLVEALKETPQSSALRDQLVSNLEAMREDAQLVADSTLEQQTKEAIATLKAGGDVSAEKIEEVLSSVAATDAPQPSEEAARLMQVSTEELDAELLAIFLEEAAEVLGTLREHRDIAGREPHNLDALTTVRRGFHTLKGSSRMVGLEAFSDAAKHVEMLMNRWLQLENDASADLLAIIDSAIATFADWVDQLNAGGSAWRDASALTRTSDALLASLDPSGDDASPQRLARPPSPERAVAEVPATALSGNAADFDLDLSLEEAPDSEEPAVAPAEPMALDMDLDDGPGDPVADLSEIDLTATLMESEFGRLSSGEEEVAELDLTSTLVESVSDAFDSLDDGQVTDLTTTDLDLRLGEPKEVELDLSATSFDSDLMATLSEPMILLDDSPADETPVSAPVVPAPLTADDGHVVELDLSATGFEQDFMTSLAEPMILLDDSPAEDGLLPPAAAPVGTDALAAPVASAPDEAPAAVELDLSATGLEQDFMTSLSEPILLLDDSTDPAPSEPAAEINDAVEAAPAAEIDLGTTALDQDLTASLPAPLLLEPAAADTLSGQAEMPEAPAPAAVETATAITPPSDDGLIEVAIEDSDEDIELPVINLASLDPSEPTPGSVAQRVAELIDTPSEPIADGDVSVGANTLSRGLYDLYMVESAQHLGKLRNSQQHIAHNPLAVPDLDTVRAAHTLAGISGTARFDPLYSLAKALEHALHRLHESNLPPTRAQSDLLGVTLDTLEAMQAQVARLQMPLEAPELVEQLDELRPHAEQEEQPVAFEPIVESLAADDVISPVPENAAVPAASFADAAPPAPGTLSAAASLFDNVDKVQDELDEQLLPIFFEEAEELSSEISTSLRQMRSEPGSAEPFNALARLLHTLKGSARMAGAMRLGEFVHALESRLEVVSRAPSPDVVDELETGYDHIGSMLEALRNPGSQPPPPPALLETEPAAFGEALDTAPVSPVSAVTPTRESTGDAVIPAALRQAPVVEEPEAIQSARALLRVRADLVDRFVNEAGEISIARTRVEGEMRTLRRSLLDLTENVIRLRNQLREVEISAETQMQSRIAAAESQHANFDPLEFDRFTRLQEVTRMMAESVGDVTTIQQNLLRNLDGADAALHAQGRLSRDLQQALMGVRMVPFNEVSDRLYRIVRQTARELGKRANLDIVGGNIEIDRGVLDKMIAPIEHLLRNAIAHGIEMPMDRATAGKSETGQITLRLNQLSNEIALEMTDDGAGLNFDKIAARGRSVGLIGPDEHPSENRLTQLIFEPGFSTADTVTGVAGRGVGMDVVKNEALSVGGRIDVSSTRGQGSRFLIHLPLTLAVTQALLVRSGTRVYAIPSTMVEQAIEVKEDVLTDIRAKGYSEWKEQRYPLRYLPRLMGDTETQPEQARYHWILLLRAGNDSVALLIDALIGNQEIVVKNAGPQFVRLPGYTGATVLPDGEISLILNPVVLAGRRAVAEGVDEITAQQHVVAEETAHVPTVMVVDDSLTVRKITTRLLEREGYRVVTAKDGVDALEQLTELIPDVMLSDIEMPRMDGFDLARNVRADDRLKAIPIIMITSRMADKHRNYATEIGVNHYLGKPYQEDQLLELISAFLFANKQKKRA